MSRTSYHNSLPMGRTDIAKIGDYTIYRNKFRTPEGDAAIVYDVMQGSKKHFTSASLNDAYADAIKRNVA